MKESVFTTEIVNSLESFGLYVYKIADIPNAARRVIRFIPVKPCDVIACSPKGRFIAIETKQFKKSQGLTKSVMQEGQIYHLDRIVKRGGKAFVIVNVRIEANKRKNQKRINACGVFNWKTYREKILDGSLGAKVIRDQSEGTWIESSLDDKKKRVWNLQKLLTM